MKLARPSVGKEIDLSKAEKGECHDGKVPRNPTGWNRKELEMLLEAMSVSPFWNVYPGQDSPPRVRQMVLNLARYFKIKPEELG